MLPDSIRKRFNNLGTSPGTRLCLALLVLIPFQVSADWVNLTGAETAENIAEIVVTDEGVLVEFEVYPRDADKLLLNGEFAMSIVADGEEVTPQVLLQEERERKDRFSPFAGMIDPRTRRAIPGPPEDKSVIFLEVLYPLEGRPEQLIIAPPMNEDGFATVTVGFLLYHKAAPVVDFRYLSRPEALNLNWDDPWFTAFENKNLVRHHRWPQMTFLYVEPREVRHESLIRVRDLMQWTEENPEFDRTLTAEEQAAIMQTAGEFFASRNPVTIDGVEVQRSGYRAEFLDITPIGLQAMPSGAQVDASAALLGISESYWVDALPDGVAMTWQLFDEQVDQVPTNIIDPAGPYPSFIDSENPVLEWTNFLTSWNEPSLRSLPADDDRWFSMSALRSWMSGTPSEEEVTLIVSELLRRSAIAYLEREPVRHTEALTMLVADPDRAGLRTQLDELFAVPTTGGGVAGVVALGTPVIEELTALEDQEGFSVRASWRAEIKGQHWGHVDQRILRFRALLDVVENDGFWKISDLTVLEARPDDGS